MKLCLENKMINYWASQVEQWYRTHLPMKETQGTRARPLGQKDPLEKELATPSSILTWKIPRAEELGELQSDMG